MKGWKPAKKQVDVFLNVILLYRGIAEEASISMSNELSFLKFGIEIGGFVPKP